MKDLFSEVRKQEDEMKSIRESFQKTSIVKSLVRQSIINQINFVKNKQGNLRNLEEDIHDIIKEESLI